MDTVCLLCAEEQPKGASGVFSMGAMVAEMAKKRKDNKGGGDLEEKIKNRPDKQSLEERNILKRIFLPHLLTIELCSG